jgi:excinuclease UvrABC nuclease subunit
MRSDFLASAGQKAKAKRVAARIDGLDFFVIATQLEPLILESSPVLRHKPKYNPRLKDDKRCPT